MKNGLVFVYGTLKFGGVHHSFLEGSEYLGIAETKNKYCFIEMCELPFILLYKDNHNIKIRGEIYEVSGSILYEIDYLEEHPYLNKRKLINVEINKILITCWCYFLNKNFYMKDKSKILNSGWWKNK